MYSVPYDPTSTPRELLQECEEVLREDQEGTQRKVAPAPAETKATPKTKAKAKLAPKRT